MTPGATLLEASLLGPAIWRLGVVATVLRGLTHWPRVCDGPDPVDTPLVSVLVPARNEERGLEACLASLSAQTYASVEVVVVDDASMDRTPEIIAEAARGDGRLRALRVPGPPPGWTGKNFALATAVGAARGAWLCFTDADTIHARDSVRRALGFAQAGGFDLLSMTSRQLTESFWERVVQPVVFGLLDQWFPLGRVSDPISPLAAANGIFVLVRREA